MSVQILAEIAQGYEGNPFLAQLLVKGAVSAGANAVKMQLIIADELCVSYYPYYELFSSLSMPINIWADLIDYTHSYGCQFYVDIYGQQSAELALKLGVDGVKVSTTDFYNKELIVFSLKSFKHVLLSMGGIPFDDISDLLSNINYRDRLTLLHGFQAEPTNISDNHMNRIHILRTFFPDIEFGFMDHSDGSNDESPLLPILALGTGISLIEKHISLDYLLEIEDYVSSLSIDKFAKFVSAVRSVEPALGISSLELTPIEKEYGLKAGKVAVASKALCKGTCLVASDILMKRVSTTPIPDSFRKQSDVLGRVLCCDVDIEQPITLQSF